MLEHAQLLFMLALFGYMLFLIFFKWTIDWSDPPAGASAPPSLVDTLIGIVLTPGTVVDQMYNGQAGLQGFLLLIVFFSVPVMLCVECARRTTPAEADVRAGACAELCEFGWHPSHLCVCVCVSCCGWMLSRQSHEATGAAVPSQAAQPRPQPVRSAQLSCMHHPTDRHPYADPARPHTRCLVHTSAYAPAGTTSMTAHSPVRRWLQRRGTLR